MPPIPARRLRVALSALAAAAVLSGCQFGAAPADARHYRAHTIASYAATDLQKAGPSGRLLDRVYTTHAGRPVRLDAYLPVSGGTSRAAVIIVHGGGFASQDKRALGAVHLAALLNASGIVALSIDYTLAPTGVLGVPVYEADMKQIASAVGWARLHATELGINPNRIVLFGGSAGGTLVLESVYGPIDPPHVQAVVAWSPMTDLTTFTEQSGVMTPQTAWYLGCLEKTCPRLWQAASPVNLPIAGRGGPPTLIVNGDHEFVPTDQARAMDAALAAAGVEHHLVLLRTSDHAFAYLQQAIKPTIDFVASVVGGKAS